MIKIIRDIFRIINKEEKKKIFILQFLILVNIFFEVISVSFIVYFSNIISGRNIEKLNFLTKIFNKLDLINYFSFIVFIGLICFSLLICASIISIFFNFIYSKFGQIIGENLSNRLFFFYLKKSWTEHISLSHSEISQKIINDAPVISYFIIVPLIQIIPRIAISLIMVFLIIYSNFAIGIFLISSLVIIYSFLFKKLQSRFAENGKIISQISEKRIKLINESLGSIKELTLSAKKTNIFNIFKNLSTSHFEAHASNQVLTILPKYVAELFLYAFIFLVFYYFFFIENFNLEQIFSLFIIYIFALAKLIPNAHQIFQCLSSFTIGTNVFQKLKKDFINTMNISDLRFSNEESSTLKNNFFLKKEIVLKNLSYKYPGAKKFLFDKISLSFPASRVIGIYGETGSGKTSLVDLITGLILPTEGQIIVDNQKIDDSNISDFQKTVGYVSQNPYFFNNSITENITFGLSSKDIDSNKLNQAISISCLKDVINNLPDGLNSNIGERGHKLSGGQRQRLAIARAVYNNQKQIYIFDESTSALDETTEKLLLKNVIKTFREKTIFFISHSSGVKNICDIIYKVENGNVYLEK